MVLKLLIIRFDKVDRFIIIYDGIRYLLLFPSERYGKIYDRIRYIISKKSDSNNYLPIERTLTFYDVAILIISVVNKNKNHHYYNIFLEKWFA